MKSIVYGRSVTAAFLLALLLAPTPGFSDVWNAETSRYELISGGGSYGLPVGHHEYYITQANNLQSVTDISGENQIWDEAKSVIWPRGSGEIVIDRPCRWYGAIGDFSLDTKLDTTLFRSYANAAYAGRTPRNFWWREHGKYYEAQQDWDGDGVQDLPVAEMKLRVSTREGDLEAWPPEFRTDIDGDGIGDIDGDPIVLSDEDVVIVHGRGPSLRGSSIYDLDGDVHSTGHGPRFAIQLEDRIMSFGNPAAQDIQFTLSTVRNMSRWHPHAPNDNPALGPVTPADRPVIMPGDWTGFMMGQQADCQGLGDGPRWLGYMPALRMVFLFDQDFTAPNFRDQVPLAGTVILHTPELDGEEIPVTTATTDGAGGALRPWRNWNDRPSTEVSWKMFGGHPNYADRQSPGANPGNVADLRADSTIYYSIWTTGKSNICAQSDDLVIKPDSSVQFDFVWIIAKPVNNPVLDQSMPDGINVEARPLVDLAKMAYKLYNTDYALPKAPTAPNIKLIPGDHKVTINWDDLPLDTPDPFLPADDPSQGFRMYDFEGFRVYRSRTGQVADAELLAQFDLRNGIVLETGVKKRLITVVDEDGNEVKGLTGEVTDTLGFSPYDTQRRYGLGKDTGLKFAFVDEWDNVARKQRLTNGFRYFYTVTSYDWNMGESLESRIIFSEASMVIPRSDPNTYLPAKIEVTQMYDYAGNALDPLADAAVAVENGVMLGSAVPSNNFSDAQVTINNASLIERGEEYKIRIDSIVGGPGTMINHLIDPTFDPKIWETVFVSLLDAGGQVVGTDRAMLRLDVDAINDNAFTTAEFRLNPTPVEEKGVAFSVIFNLSGHDFNYMQINPVEVIKGSTTAGEDADIRIKGGYNDGANNLPIGYRAADLRIKFVDAGPDSLTLEVRDETHGVPVLFSDYPGDGWCFFNSWSRFVRLLNDFREDLTYSDLYSGGPKLSRTIEKYNSADFPLSKDAKINLHLCGLQIVVRSKYPPVAGDEWLVRTNLGTLPDSVGRLSPLSPRPIVTGVSYGIKVNPDEDESADLDMSKIRVVPNPFIIQSPWDYSPQKKQIQFINLPNSCEIRVYTLTGNLVQVLKHDGASNAYDRTWKGGTLDWDLMNRFNSPLASGWYIWYATDLDTGRTEKGKFAIIQ